MKKWSFFVLLIFCFALPFFYAGASGNPERYATAVVDVFDPDVVDEWIISPDEEPIDDEDVDNAPECDIYGVCGWYDVDYLRVDILLDDEISFDLQTFYGIKFEYTEINEYYYYYVGSDELIYIKEQNGKITQRKTLTKKNSEDIAGVADSGDLDNAAVYFIINKEDHISGKKGKSYYLTSTFFSGFVSKNDKLQIADDTIEVDMNYVY